MTRNSPEISYCRIGEDVQFGRGVRVVMPSNLYGCVIGDDCFIGPFVEIQRDAKIGRNVRVQSHSFICSLVEIGDDCFIGHGTKFINDTFSEVGRPSYVEKQYWKHTIVGNNVTIGTNATILPVRISPNTIIGAGAVITKDILRSGIYVGNPAVFLREIPQKL